MFWSNYTTINRRGYDITLPSKAYNMLKENNIYISLCINRNNKSSTVQLLKHNGKKTEYVGTLKNYLGAYGFKTSNNLNFKKSNLMF